VSRSTALSASCCCEVAELLELLVAVHLLTSRTGRSRPPPGASAAAACFVTFRFKVADVLTAFDPSFEPSPGRFSTWEPGGAFIPAEHLVEVVAVDLDELRSLTRQRLIGLFRRGRRRRHHERQFLDLDWRPTSTSYGHVTRGLRMHRSLCLMRSSRPRILRTSRVRNPREEGNLHFAGSGSRILPAPACQISYSPSRTRALNQTHLPDAGRKAP